MKSDIWDFIEQYDGSKLVEDRPTFNVLPSFIDWSKLHTKIFLSRYSRGKEKHWKENEERSIYIGLLGQKIFEILCQLLPVPTVSNDPVFDWRRWKDYDFRIPKMGKIEVKTFDYNGKLFLVKVEEWHHNDYVVAFKLKDEKPTQITMKGWLSGKEVERLPIAEKGQRYFSKYAACYYCDLNKLHSSHKFFQILCKQRIPEPFDLP